VRFGGYDVSEDSGRLELTASGSVPCGLLPGIISIAGPGIIAVVSRFVTDPVAALLVALFVIVAGGYVFVLKIGAHSTQRRGEGVIFDRRADEVTRAGARLCALSEVSSIRVRRDANEGSLFQVGLVVGGLHSRGAPRAMPSAFDDVVVVAESGIEDEMRGCAARIAAYAGVRLEERGW
jgi:hypothetical protein